MSQGVSVKFRVDGGNDLIAYMERIKRNSSDLSKQLIENARKENSSAAGQLKLIQEQIAALEKRNRLAAQMNNIIGLYSVNERLKNAPNRQNTLSQIISKNEENYRNDIIDEKTYKSREKRLNELWDRTQPKSIGSEYKEYLNKQNEQLRETRLTNKFTKEQIDAIKQGAKETVSSVKRGDEKIEDVLERSKQGTPEQKLSAAIAKEQLEHEKKKERGEKNSLPNNFLGFLRALTFDKSMSLAGSMTGAKTELDLLKPMLSMIGMASGGLLGNSIDALNLQVLGTGMGKTNFGALGASLGEAAGEMFGTALQRSYTNREALTKANYGLQALTGKDMAIDAFGANGLGGTGKSLNSINLSRYGLDYINTANLQNEVALKQGSGNNLNGTAENIIAAHLGLGIGKEISLGLIELSRSTKENIGDPLKTITGTLNAGSGSIFRNDRTFLGEFLTKQILLTKEILKTSNTVSNATTFSVLNRLGAMGGQFDLHDPRSIGLLASMQSSIAGGGSSEFQKVANFLALRQAMPGASLTDILIEQQKGLGSDKNLSTILQNIRSRGGGSDQMILSIADAFGWQNNIAAAKTVYENMNGLISGQTNFSQIGIGAFDEQSVRKLAQSQISKYSTSNAEIENAFTESVTGGLGLMKDKMVGLFGTMVDELKDYVVSMIRNDSGGSNFSPTNGIKNGYGKPVPASNHIF